MSRDEAIKVLKEYLELDKDTDSEYLEAQRVANASLIYIVVYRIANDMD